LCREFKTSVAEVKKLTKLLLLKASRTQLHNMANSATEPDADDGATRSAVEGSEQDCDRSGVPSRSAAPVVRASRSPAAIGKQVEHAATGVAPTRTEYLVSAEDSPAETSSHADPIASAHVLNRDRLLPGMDCTTPIVDPEAVRALLGQLEPDERL